MSSTAFADDFSGRWTGSIVMGQEMACAADIELRQTETEFAIVGGSLDCGWYKRSYVASSFRIEGRDLMIGLMPVGTIQPAQDRKPARVEFDITGGYDETGARWKMTFLREGNRIVISEYVTGRQTHEYHRIGESSTGILNRH